MIFENNSIHLYINWGYNINKQNYALLYITSKKIMMEVREEEHDACIQILLLKYKIVKSDIKILCKFINYINKKYRDNKIDK